MGNAMKKFSGKKGADQSAVGQYPPPSVQFEQQPGVPMQQQMPGQFGPQPGVPMQQQMPPRYGPPQFNPAPPPGYGGQQYPNVPPMPNRGGPPASLESDAYLAALTGVSPADVGHLRMEFYIYANSLGIIDRDGFRKLYIASLLNKTWDILEREAEAAFRTFDVNQTGGLDFNEYMMACARMMRGPSQPQMYPY